MMRNHRMDNMKAFLIFCVVLGHFLELNFYGLNTLVYKVLYSFHMPAFAFCTGLYAAGSPQKILKNMIYPYVVFQTLYLVFARFVLSTGAELQYVLPYWMMWYLLAVIIWNLVLPLVDSAAGTPLKKALVLVFALGLSFLVGFDKTVGYYLSLSRILVFFPFFLWGHYVQSAKPRLGAQESASKARLNGRRLVAGLSGVVVVFSILVLWKYGSLIRAEWFFGTSPYAELTCPPYFRPLWFLAAAGWIVLLLQIVPDKKLPVISGIGRNTMPIFLMHGFFVRLCANYDLFGAVSHRSVLCLALTVILLLVFSFKPVVKGLGIFMKWPVEKRNKKPDSLSYRP